MSNSLDLLSILAYDIFPFARNKGLTLIDTLMAIDIQQCQLITKSYKEGQAPTEKQLQFFQTSNTILGNLLAKEDADKVFQLEVESTFKTYPTLFCNNTDHTKSFIHKRLERYQVYKPELFKFLEEVQNETRENKVSRIADRVA